MLLELLEGHNIVLGPLKPLPLVDQEIERSTTVHRAGNELVEGCDHPSELLNLLCVSWWFQVVYSLDLIRVNLDSSILSLFMLPYYCCALS